MQNHTLIVEFRGQFFVEAVWGTKGRVVAASTREGSIPRPQGCSSTLPEMEPYLWDSVSAHGGLQFAFVILFPSLSASTSSDIVNDHL